MDRNYTGGWFQTERLAKSIARHETCEIVPFADLMPGLLIAFDKSLKRDTVTYQTVVDESMPVVNGFDAIHRCRMCKNFFTVNKSYGKHDCFAHYGYRDYTNPGAATWSCCGDVLSSLGCMECDHLPETSNVAYSNPIPTMEISLCSGLYGRTLPPSRSFFLKRYTQDEELLKVMKRHPNFLRVKLRYLEEKAYRSLLSSTVLSKTRARYVPYAINTMHKDGRIKQKDRIYVNVKSSKLIVPLSRRRNV